VAPTVFESLAYVVIGIVWICAWGRELVRFGNCAKAGRPTWAWRERILILLVVCGLYAYWLFLYTPGPQQVLTLQR
jgi:hypothetical protein